MKCGTDQIFASASEIRRNDGRFIAMARVALSGVSALTLLLDAQTRRIAKSIGGLFELGTDQTRGG